MVAFLSICAGVAAAMLLGVVLTKLEILAMLYDVRLSERGIEFFALSCIKFYTQRFENIEKVMRTNGAWRFVWATNFQNRFFQGGVLVVRARNYFLAREVIITPEDPERFLQELAGHGVPVEDLTGPGRKR